MLAGTANTAKTTIRAAALATKTKTTAAFVWVVVCPCFFVRLTPRGAPKIG
jgi:hypothetical protein